MDHILESLAGQGWAVVPGFLPSRLVTQLAHKAEAHFQAGNLSPAGVGLGKAREIHPEIRGDSICWLDSQTATQAEQDYLQRMEALRLDSNRMLQIGLFDLEAHFSRYPAGTFYRKHLDVFREDEKRTLSVICYLNENWQPGEGGALRLYPANGKPVDVMPEGGTLACFFSAGMLHEVLPASRTRLSLTGWFRRR